MSSVRREARETLSGNLTHNESVPAPKKSFSADINGGDMTTSEATSSRRKQTFGLPHTVQRWWGPFLATAVALNVARPAFRQGLPPGSDMSYHFVRSTWAYRDFFAKGHLDGWFPAFGVGAQGFLLYGPGCALHYALVRLLTLGLLSELNTFRLVVVLSLIAVPWCVRFMARSFGLAASTANLASLLSLGVSCTFGGGFRGLLSTGLLPHQIALSYWCLGLGFFARLLRQPTKKSAVWFGVCVGVLLITHPTSAWLLVITGLAIGVIEVGRRRRRPLLLSRAALGAAVAVGLSAMWWMPLTRDSDPRQQLATWGVPSFRANVRTLANGKEAVRPGLALLIIVSSVWLAGWSWQLWRTNRASRPWRLALALGPLVALAFSHWLWSNYPNTVTMLLPVRGIGNWMLIGLLPVSLALGRVMNRISTRWGSLLSACVGIALIAGPASQLDTKFIKEVSARKPSAQLETLAAELRTYVPTNGRWVMPTDWPQEKQYGVDLPQYWLVGASGRPTMNGFGGDAVTSWDIWVTDHITERSVPDAAMLLRKAGVTHVYTAGDKTGAFFSSQPALFRMVWESTPMRLFEVLGFNGASFGHTTLAFAASGRTIVPETSTAEKLSWRIEPGPSESITVARGFFTKWKATLNGKPIPVSNDIGLVSLAVGPEGGRLQLEFIRAKEDYLGLLASVLTVLALIVLPPILRRRSNRGPATAGDGVAEPVCLVRQNSEWDLGSEDNHAFPRVLPTEPEPRPSIVGLDESAEIVLNEPTNVAVSS